MSKTIKSPASSKRLAAGAKAAIHALAHAFRALVAEHSLALLAATNAVLPRRRLTYLRETYTSEHDQELIPTFLMLPEAARAVRSLAESNGGFETTTMNMDAERRFATAIQGELLRLDERREVAIYVREDARWVADVIDGHGGLVDAAISFRFNCGATSYARRRWPLNPRHLSPRNSWRESNTCIVTPCDSVAQLNQATIELSTQSSPQSPRSRYHDRHRPP